jgi:hypothetical protein
MNTQEAKTALIGEIEDTGDGSLDATADAMLERIGKFFGECVGSETFCGFSIDETRDASGQLTSLKLVPCDLVDGEPVRREGKFAAPKLVVAH